MKKLIAYLILTSIAAGHIIAATLIFGRGVASAVASCTTVHEQNASANSTTISVAFGATDYYSGQAAWNPGANVTICKVSVRLTKAAGSVSGNTYKCEIWSYDGTNITGKLAESDGVTGNNSWSDTVVDFTFSTPYAVSNGTQYAIVLTKNAAGDPANYINIHLSAAGGFGGIMAYFTSGGVRSGFDTADCRYIVYKQ